MAACALRFDPGVEAAVQATYGVNILTDEFTPRRLMVLLKYMPAGTMPWEESAAAWSQESHLLADVIDNLRELTWVTVSLWARSHKPHPPPLPRPGKQRKRLRLSQLGDYLQQED